jgi:hypothetical protein
MLKLEKVQSTVPRPIQPCYFQKSKSDEAVPLRRCSEGLREPIAVFPSLYLQKYYKSVYSSCLQSCSIQPHVSFSQAKTGASFPLNLPAFNVQQGILYLE